VGRVLVVGSINTDMVVRVPRLPAVGETVLGVDFRQVSGGKGGNQAVAAARAGAVVAMVGCVGGDQFGSKVVDELRENGVDVSQLHRLSDAVSGVALIAVDTDGQNCITVAPGANVGLTPEMVRQAEPLIAAAGVVLLQLEVPVEAVMEAATIAANYETPIILDPAPAGPLPDRLWSHLAVVTPNVVEAEALTGHRIRGEGDACAAADALIGRGVESVVVTLGASGLLVATRNDRTVLKGFPVEAVDTTAAGDAFAGALAARLAEGTDLIMAARFANAAAAVAVTRLGAQPSIPTRDEIANMLRSAN